MDRETFIRAAGELLEQGPLPQATRKIWQLGRSSGLMTAEELSALERRHALPLWLQRPLGLDVTTAVSSEVEEIDARASERIHCDRPGVLGEAVLPPIFNVLQGDSPLVKVVKGKSGIFGLGNFMRFAIVKDGYVPSMTDANNLWSWQLLKKATPHHLAGRTFICVVEGSLLFSHWLLDTLPRFSILEEFEIPPSNFDNVLIASNRHGFHQEGLAAFHIDANNVRTRQRIGPIVSCDEFVHVTPVRDNFLAAKGHWPYNSVAEMFASGVGPGKRRVFISRSKAKRRRLLNEADLHPLLTRFGFEIIFAEDLGISAMARLCASASHLVAPHGAGLANVTFMHPGGRVLELYGAHLSPEFWRISNARKLQYFCMQGRDPTGAHYNEERLAGMGHVERNHADFTIDPEALRNALELITDI